MSDTKVPPPADLDVERFATLAIKNCRAGSKLAGLGDQTFAACKTCITDMFAPIVAEVRRLREEKELIREEVLGDVASERADYMERLLRAEAERDQYQASLVDEAHAHAITIESKSDVILDLVDMTRERDQLRAALEKPMTALRLAMGELQECIKIHRERCLNDRGHEHEVFRRLLQAQTTIGDAHDAALAQPSPPLITDHEFRACLLACPLRMPPNDPLWNHELCHVCGKHEAAHSPDPGRGGER